MNVPLAVRRPWTVLLLALAAMVVAGLTGGDVQESLSPGGFEDSSSESVRAAALLDETFDAGSPDVVLLADATDLGNAEADGGLPAVDGEQAVLAGQLLTSELAARDDVSAVRSYWSLDSAPPLRSTDGSKALVLVQLAGDQSERLDTAAELRERYTASYEGLGLSVGGPDATFAEINETVESDLITAELIAFPVTALLLLLIFGTVTSAFLPLAVGGFSILGTFVALELIAGVTEVSIFALNFTTAIGLGLAIDYALLIVSRFREELAASEGPRQAAATTIATAGRTVLFSGLTVASSLAALLVFPFPFLRSFAWAGFAVVGLAVVGATVVLPAVLTLLGTRVNALAVRKLPARAADRDGQGAWHRIAMFVMRRPAPIAIVAIAALVTLGLPFLRLELALPDDRVLDPSAETRQMADVLRTDFASMEQAAASVLVTGVDATGSDAAAVAAYATELSTLDGVARVDSVAGSYLDGARLPFENPLSPGMASAEQTYLSVVPAVEPISAEGKALIEAVRTVDGPGDERLVGGPSAELVDSTESLLDTLPLGLALIGLITFAVLFWAFGSLLIPLKALALNVLSLTGMMGAMVWIFQDGRFEEALGFTATGTINLAMPVLMFVIAFGLSMDYEVFLLSRIREEWNQSHDPIGSVASGLERTGGIVTAAAVLIGVVFLAFGLTASVSFMVMFGLGMTLAIAVDAFIIRATLVPAFMRLAGRANWWAPEPLRRFHERFGFDETGGRPQSPAGPAATEPSSALLRETASLR